MFDQRSSQQQPSGLYQRTYLEERLCMNHAGPPEPCSHPELCRFAPQSEKTDKVYECIDYCSGVLITSLSSTECLKCTLFHSLIPGAFIYLIKSHMVVVSMSIFDAIKVKLDHTSYCLSSTAKVIFGLPWIKQICRQIISYLCTVCSCNQTGYVSTQLTGSSDGVECNRRQLTIGMLCDHQSALKPFEETTLTDKTTTCQDTTLSK